MVGKTGLEPVRMSDMKGQPLEPLCALPHEVSCIERDKIYRCLDGLENIDCLH